jgi:hypothetical protein
VKWVVGHIPILAGGVVEPELSQYWYGWNGGPANLNPDTEPPVTPLGHAIYQTGFSGGRKNWAAYIADAGVAPPAGVQGVLGVKALIEIGSTNYIASFVEAEAESRWPTGPSWSNFLYSCSAFLDVRLVGLLHYRYSCTYSIRKTNPFSSVWSRGWAQDWRIIYQTGPSSYAHINQPEVYFTPTRMVPPEGLFWVERSATDVFSSNISGGVATGTTIPGTNRWDYGFVVPGGTPSVPTGATGDAILPWLHEFARGGVAHGEVVTITDLIALTS